MRIAGYCAYFVNLSPAQQAEINAQPKNASEHARTEETTWTSKERPQSSPAQAARDLALVLSASVKKYPSEMMVTNGAGTDRCGPWIIERAIRDVRDKIDGLPEGFTFHDLRHYLASLLIASGTDIKTVKARMRHASARTTLDTYGHLWPDADESTRTPIGAVITKRMDSLQTAAYPLRTQTT